MQKYKLYSNTVDHIFCSLIELVTAGNFDGFKTMITKNSDLMKNGIYGTALLYIASENGHAEIVEFLNQNGTNKPYTNGKTPLWIASQNGHTDVVKILIQPFRVRGDVNIPDIEGKTPLWIASQNGHIDVVNILIEARALNHSDNQGKTPLLVASQNGHTEVVKALLNKNKNTVSEGIDEYWIIKNDQPDIDGNTPLYAACKNNHTKVVELLIEAKVNLNASAEHGTTSVWIASMKGNKDILEMLIHAGADVNQADSEKTTPLSVVCENPDKVEDEKQLEEMLNILINAGANINTFDCHGETPLTRACANGFVTIVQILLDKGADVEGAVNDLYRFIDHPDNNLIRPIQSAFLIQDSNVRKEIVEMLNQEGETFYNFIRPIQSAILIQNSDVRKEIVDMLIQRGATFYNFIRPIQSAILIQDSDVRVKVIDMLIQSGATFYEDDFNNKRSLTIREIQIIFEKKGEINLTKSCTNGDLDMVRREVESSLTKEQFINKANWGYDRAYEPPPLFNACKYGHFEIAKFLIENGANVNITFYDITPLIVACQHRNIDIAKLLINKGADINHRVRKTIITPITCAAKAGLNEIMILLLDKGVNTNPIESKYVDYESVFSFKKGDEITPKSVTHQSECSVFSPIYIALNNGHEQIVSLLLQRTSDFNRWKYEVFVTFSRFKDIIDKYYILPKSEHVHPFFNSIVNMIQTITVDTIQIKEFFKEQPFYYKYQEQLGDQGSRIGCPAITLNFKEITDDEIEESIKAHDKTYIQEIRPTETIIQNLMRLLASKDDETKCQQIRNRMKRIYFIEIDSQPIEYTDEANKKNIKRVNMMYHNIIKPLIDLYDMNGWHLPTNFKQGDGWDYGGLTKDAWTQIFHKLKIICFNNTKLMSEEEQVKKWGISVSPFNIGKMIGKALLDDVQCNLILEDKIYMYLASKPNFYNPNISYNNKAFVFLDTHNKHLLNDEHHILHFKKVDEIETFLNEYEDNDIKLMSTSDLELVRGFKRIIPDFFGHFNFKEIRNFLQSKIDQPEFDRLIKLIDYFGENEVERKVIDSIKEMLNKSWEDGNIEHIENFLFYLTGTRFVPIEIDIEFQSGEDQLDMGGDIFVIEAHSCFNKLVIRYPNSMDSMDNFKTEFNDIMSSSGNFGYNIAGGAAAINAR